MAKSSLSLASLMALNRYEVEFSNRNPRVKKSWSWLLVGCITLPIKLPFPTPFDCKTPRQAPTIRRQPKPVPVSRPAPIPEPVLEAPEPIPPQSVQGRAPTTVAQGNLSQLIFAEVNDIRQSYGLQPLRWNGNVANVARRHSRNMAVHNFFSHADPDGNTALERLLNAGVRFNLVAENLALNEHAPDPVAIAIEGWLDSPGHRRNILRAEVTETGVGVVRRGEEYFFTQVFIRRP